MTLWERRGEERKKTLQSSRPVATNFYRGTVKGREQFLPKLHRPGKMRDGKKILSPLLKVKNDSFNTRLHLFLLYVYNLT